MKLRNRALLSFVSGLMLLAPARRAVAQTVTATIALPGGPVAVAVNPVTGQAYANYLTSGHSCTPECRGWYYNNAGAINPSTGSTTTLWTSGVETLSNESQVGTVAVNAVTNQIYMSDFCCDVVAITGATNQVTVISSPPDAAVSASSINLLTNKIYTVINNNTFQFGVNVIDGATNTTTAITDPKAVGPWAVDVNPATNKSYVANKGSANLSVIDGATNSVTTVSVGTSPFAVAVNPITNKIYVVNNTTSGTVTVIDGVTLGTTVIPVGSSPFAIGVNPVTNKVYVANDGSNNITVIDGATNATTTLTDTTASHPRGVAVDALTNQTYVANTSSATVTVIDGATNALTTVTDPNATGDTLTLVFQPITPIGLDPVANIVYAIHNTSANVSVIAGVAGTGTPDFALGETSASLTLPSGGQATDTIIVGPPYGNTVDLSCSVSGPAPAPSCALSATSVTPGPTYGTATLTITAPADAAMIAPSHPPRLAGFYAAWLPLMFGITLMGGSRKRRGQWLLVGFLLLLLLWQVACGGGSGTGQTTHTQTNYTVTVTGTSGAMQHTAQVAVTVE